MSAEALPRWNLPEVNFLEADSATIKEEMISDFESFTGITLAPADPRRQFLLWMIDRFIQAFVAHNQGDQQNLLSYAQGEYLDAIGELFQTERLPSSKAVTTLRFTLSQALANAYTIPVGFEVTNGIVTFVTDEELIIDPGELIGEVVATCTEAGDVGNDYLAGQISTIVTPMAFLESATNTSTTSGGADEELDADYAERIRLAPNSWASAGPVKAYIFHTYSVSSAIIDVAVTSPSPGVVNVAPLIEGGTMPSEEILANVEAYLNADTIRPLTDEVHAISPKPVEYEINVDYWISEEDKNKSATIQKAVTDAVEKYRMWQQTKIGRDITHDQLVFDVIGAGAARVDFSTLKPSGFIELAADEVAQCTSVTVTYKGYKTI